MLRHFVIVTATLAFTSCNVQVDGSEFAHSQNSGNRPWTHEQFDAADDKFTFAVFSDLTGGERDQVFEIAVAQLNLLRPELIINVGDLIDGGTENLSEIDAQWNSFDERADRARAPVFYVGGNHDLSGEVLQGAWEARVGPRYYHFVYKNVLFLVLDTEDNTPERTQEIFEIRRAGVDVAAAISPSSSRPISSMPSMRIQMLPGHFYLCTRRRGNAPRQRILQPSNGH
jgi:hypothetical protein